VRNYVDEITLMLNSVCDDRELILTVMSLVGEVRSSRPPRTWEFTLALDKPIILGLGSSTASAALTFVGYGPYVLVGIVGAALMSVLYLALKVAE